MSIFPLNLYILKIEINLYCFVKINRALLLFIIVLDIFELKKPYDVPLFLEYSKTPLSRQHWDNSKSGGLANLAA